MNEAQLEDKTEEMTERKRMSTEEFNELAKRALELDVHRPTWCIPEHYDLYRICYLMVKEEPAANGMNAANRRKLIIKLMNQHITATRNILFEKAKAQQAKLKEAQEAKANETTSEVPVEQSNA